MAIRENRHKSIGIDAFLGEVSSGGGLAQTSMYRVQLPSLGLGLAQSMLVLCSKCEFPMRQITTFPSRSGVDVDKVAYGYAVGDTGLSFYLLNDYSAKEYFETWQNLALNQETLEAGYHGDYAKNVVIQQLRKGVGFPIAKKKVFDAGKIPSSIRGRLPRLGPLDLAQGQFDLNAISKDDVVYECTLINAFPTSMTAIPMSTAGGGLMEVSVQLSFTNWKSEFGNPRTSQLKEGLVGGLIQAGRSIL